MQIIAKYISDTIYPIYNPSFGWVVINLSDYERRFKSHGKRGSSDSMLSLEQSSDGSGSFDAHR